MKSHLAKKIEIIFSIFFLAKDLSFINPVIMHILICDESNTYCEATIKDS